MLSRTKDSKFINNKDKKDKDKIKFNKYYKKDKNSKNKN
jgi:hypothetical protein